MSTGLQRDEVLVDGVRVRFHHGGDGPALVLLHGLFMDHRAFRLITPLLARHFHVIAPDLPGFGESEKTSRHRGTREAQSESVRGLLRSLAVDKIYLAGHAMGGAIALTLAADHPELVESLAVLNAAVYEVDLPLLGALSMLPGIGRGLFRHLYGRDAFRAYFRDEVYPRGHRIDDAQLDAWYAAFDSPEGRASALRAFRATVDTASLTARVRKVRASTLVLCGDRDTMCPVRIGTRLAHEMQKARLDVMYDTAHCPHEERPDDTAHRLVEHFLVASDP